MNKINFKSKVNILRIISVAFFAIVFVIIAKNKSTSIISGTNGTSYEEERLYAGELEGNADTDVNIKYVFGNNITFDGSSQINTNIPLFSEENVNRNFEVTADIIEGKTQPTSQSTYLSCMDESGTPYPGFAFRTYISSSQGNQFELVTNASTNTELNKKRKYNISIIDNVKFCKIGNTFYGDYNNTGELTELHDYSDLARTFNVPLSFGSSINGAGTPYRYVSAKLSNMTTTLTYSQDETSVTLPTPTRTNFIFSGWYDDASYTNKVGDGGSTISLSTLSGNTTLYAKWEKEIRYIVEYYKDNEFVDSVTEVAHVLDTDPDAIPKNDELFDNNKYEGYNIDTTLTGEIPDTIENGSTIKVYYTAIGNYSYIVHYKEQGTEKDLAEDRVVTGQTLGETVQEEAKTVEGYEVVGNAVANILIETGNNEYTFYYKKKMINYTVNYYYVGETSSSRTITQKAEYKSIIETYDNQIEDGYRFDRVEGLPLEIADNEENNIINVYYIQQKTLRYTISFYKDNINVTSDNIERTIVVDYTESNMITILDEDKAQITDDKYPGYIKKRTEPSPVPDAINSGRNIQIYYVPDETERKNISYTIYYYKDGELFETVTDTVSVQVLEETAPVNTNLLRADRYEGYTLHHTNPEVIRPVSEGDSIRAYYTKNEEQKKEVNCTLKYYKGDTLVTTVRKTKQVYISEEDEIEIEEDWISEDNYYGYTLDRIEPELNQNRKVESGSIISVYYKIDNTQEKTLQYTVEYYIDDVLDNSITRTETVQVLKPDKITIDRSLINNNDLYEGYRLDRTNPLTVEDQVDDNSVIQVYYISINATTKKLKYTIEYYRDGVKKDTVVDMRDVDASSASNKVPVNKNLIAEDKYEGYTIGSTVPVEIPDEIDDGSTIKVMYIPDPAQKKLLSYTVEYYKDGTKVDEITRTEEVQVLESNNIRVDTSLITNNTKYPGYIIERTTLVINPTEEECKVPSGTIIKIYYVQDPSQQKTLRYNVIYYKDGMQYGETEVETQNVYKLDPNIITVKKEKINLTNKIDGYVVARTEPETIPDAIESGSTIIIYYVKRTDLSYTVHYKEKGTNARIAADKVVVNKTFGDIIRENAIEIVGYTKEEPTTANIEITTGDNEHTFYYKKAKYKYTVEYYYDGQIDPSKTKEYEAEYNTTVSDYEDEIIEGYKLKEEVTPIVISNNENENVMRVHYVIDSETSKIISYEVKYYKDGLEVSTDSFTKNKVVSKDSGEELEVEKSEINIEDKYDGYELEKIMLDQKIISSIPDKISNNSIIRIYYKQIEKDEEKNDDKDDKKDDNNDSNDENTDSNNEDTQKETVINHYYIVDDNSSRTQNTTNSTNTTRTSTSTTQNTITIKNTNTTSNTNTTTKNTVSNTTNTTNSNNSKTINTSNPQTGDIIVNIALGAIGLIIVINIIQIIIEKIKKNKNK